MMTKTLASAALALGLLISLAGRRTPSFVAPAPMGRAAPALAARPSAIPMAPPPSPGLMGPRPSVTLMEPPPWRGLSEAHAFGAPASASAVNGAGPRR